MVRKTAGLSGWRAACRAPAIVLRTPTRSMIAKARFEDYDRTLRRKS
ncbi:hypothetical protein ACFYUD_35505 [Nocardia tengchongensis]